MIAQSFESGAPALLSNDPFSMQVVMRPLKPSGQGSRDTTGK